MRVALCQTNCGDDVAANEQQVFALLDEAAAGGADLTALPEVWPCQGSAAQVRESAAALVRFAKSTGVSVLIIGHVTKEGVIAGPRILEHMVDGPAGSKLAQSCDGAVELRAPPVPSERYPADMPVSGSADGRHGANELARRD